MEADLGELLCATCRSLERCCSPPVAGGPLAGWKVRAHRGANVPTRVHSEALPGSGVQLPPSHSLGFGARRGGSEARCGFWPSFVPQTLSPCQHPP